MYLSWCDHADLLLRKSAIYIIALENSASLSFLQDRIVTLVLRFLSWINSGIMGRICNLIKTWLSLYHALGALKALLIRQLYLHARTDNLRTDASRKCYSGGEQTFESVKSVLQSAKSCRNRWWINYKLMHISLYMILIYYIWSLGIWGLVWNVYQHFLPSGPNMEHVRLYTVRVLYGWSSVWNI